MPEHNKAAGQDIVLDFDSGTVPDTAQVRTAVAGDTGWVARIVQGRIAVPAHSVVPVHIAVGSGIARIGAARQDPRLGPGPEHTNPPLARTRILQIKE